MKKTTDEIRKIFLKFFKEKKHIIVPGSSLVSSDDSSLLFTNSGMNQFKNLFLKKDPNFKYTRIATVQNCLRTGGKHNDFENVGYTFKHHTFFEMLGNFSFGDYFKEEAITYAWEFLTSREWLNLPKKKLWITVYDNDLESHNIWEKNTDVEKEKIIKIGDEKNCKYTSDNFWQMGNTGPCGPSTEIFYDKGRRFFGNPPGKNANNGERFVEIWNIVFMQFNKIDNNNMTKLQTPSVDTGMGLERISGIIQKVNSNYDIDIFQPLIKLIVKISDVTNINYKHVYVIADHIRSSAFIISENIIPSNEKHGYVLRRIIRRAIRHGHYIGIKNLFLHKLIPALIQSMGENAHILQKKQKYIETILKLEEEKFTNTLEIGLKLLNIEIKKLKNNVLNGKIIFDLYDTYGFPPDLTIDICREKNIIVNLEEFKKKTENRKKEAKNKKFYKTNNFNTEILNTYDIPSNFVGYTEKQTESHISKIIYENNFNTIIKKNEFGIIILKNTPFYAELGGQIGDIGFIENNHGTFEVHDTQKFHKTIGHIGKVISGHLKVGNKVIAKINYIRRFLIQSNHTATHLLHSTLRQVLGNHIFQKGSYITDRFLRFDFSHQKFITRDDLQKIENIVNMKISQNILIKTNIMKLEEAKKKNIIALFHKKYDEIVRVLSINNFSIELCGGTHAKRTGDLGLFKITNERSISSGIRRIEATTGQIALYNIHKNEKKLQEISEILKTKNTNIVDSIKVLILNNKKLKQKINKINEKETCRIVDKISKNFVLIKNTKVVIKSFNNHDLKFLRSIIDKIKIKLKSAIIILVNMLKDHANIIIGVTPNISKKISAKNLLNALLKNLDGKGGGKTSIAEGGINKLTCLSKELINIKNWINYHL
ncbi:MAG: alanine--tRNA ligase [Buchnera aphidicola (Nurudea yanoniella)]